MARAEPKFYRLTFVFSTYAFTEHRTTTERAKELAIQGLTRYPRAKTCTASNFLNTDVYIAQRDKEGKVI